MPQSNHFDVIVIGVGSMGSSACCFLAECGMKVLGLEQFDIVHEQGSHAGQSRIIRKAYFEHPDYVPLLERSYHNWKKLEQQTTDEVYHRTGIVYFGPPEHQTMAGVRKSSSLYDIPVDSLSKEESFNRFPAFQIPADFEILFEHDAGLVTPERAILLYAEQARKYGAAIHTHEKVSAWKEEGAKISVVTDKNDYTADKLVITAGSWTSKMIPDLKTELKVTRQTLAWVNPGDTEKFSLGNFPCWFIEDPDRGMFYGFPILPERFGGPVGLKLASHRPGEMVDPDRINRRSNDEEEANIRYVLSKYLPEAGNDIISIKTCLYTYSKDENFIIDHLPGYNKKIVVACGFSGHGFKFVSVVGEILADLAMKGKTELPVAFLSLSRFGK
ncbi:MAG TPA: N-methyl-L-tryptophan oxidase [Chitinophagaceae bacterium]|nr:N-methyl-L-tryptophan oxidase [Chitinophagaceae bacterium]